MQQNKRVVLLLSGGIDSTVLLYWLVEKGYEIFPLIINYGQVTFGSEYRHSTNILNGLDINNLFSIDISQVSRVGMGSLVGEYPNDVTSQNEWHSTEFFPNRNLILLTLATSYAYKMGVSNIAIGVVGKSYKDTSLDFLNSLMKCLEASLMPVNIIAPFADREREEVIKSAVRLGVPLKMTFSCNALNNRHCYLCNSCYEREIVFDQIRELSRDLKLDIN